MSYFYSSIIQDFNDNADLLDTAVAAKETTAGAQAKANTAEANAKAYTDTKVAGLVNSAPAALDTLKELANALGSDPNYAATTATLIGTKAPLASPALEGTPTATTAAVDTSTTQVATTAFVLGQAGTTAPTMNGTAGVGASKRYARADHVHPVDTSRAGQVDFAAHLADLAQRGLSTATQTVEDLNNPKLNSIQWFTSTTLNSPEAYWGHVNSFSPDSGNNITQISQSTTTGNVFTRSKVNGTWGTWGFLLNSALMGIPNGIATLGADGRIPPSQLGGDISAQINRLAYDVYNLYQEQYYTGNSPVSPSFGSAKSMIFDTMKDATKYNTAGSNVVFATDHISCGYTAGTYTFPNSAVDYPFNGFTKGGSCVGVASSLIVDDNSWAIWNSNVPNGQNFPVRLDMGSTVLVTAVEHQSGSTGGNLEGWTLYTTPDGGTSYNYIAQDGMGSSVNTSQFLAIDPSRLAYAKSRYFYLNIDSGNQSQSGSILFDFIRLRVAMFIASTYKSNPFALTFTPTGAKAFISQRLETGATVTPKMNCGGTLVTGVAGASRVDPNFPTYNEVEYTFNLSGKASPTEFQMILIPSGMNVADVKRYGVYFY